MSIEAPARHGLLSAKDEGWRQWGVDGAVN
jgi:hypothetical protein